MNQVEQRKATQEFVRRWKDAKESEARSCWIELCQNVLGIANSKYRHAPAVRNSLVWLGATDEPRERIETCTQSVLDARAARPDDSLAALYVSDKMPDDLLASHKALDAAVTAAYGIDFDGDEESSPHTCSICTP